MKDKTTLTTITAVGLTLVILALGYFFLINQSREATDNPYAYNLDEYQDVDAKLINYTEISHINIDTEELEHLNAIALDSNDNIYIAINSCIVIMQEEGQQASIIPLDSPATCIAISESNRIYVGVGDHVEVFNSNGLALEQWSSMGDQAVLTSITISGNSLYAADYGNRTIWHFDTTGFMKGMINRSNASIDFSIPSPYFDVATDPDGSLWAVNPGAHRIINFDSEYNLSRSWGVMAMETEGFSGCCNPSHIAILPDGSFVTAEKGLPRIKIYNPNGELSSIVAGPDSFNNTIAGCSGEALIKDIAVDSKGRIFVLDRGTMSIRIFVKK